MKMTFEKFSQILKYIEEVSDTCEAMDSLLHGRLNRDCYAFEVFADGKMETFVIQLLEMVMDDTDDWISWWIYETDFGKKNTVVHGDDGEKWDLDTIEALWDFLRGPGSRF